MVYWVFSVKIEVIFYGIFDVFFTELDLSKVIFGFSGRSVILTFGLLFSGKGIEVMIDVMLVIL
jgi:hypothetical protein